MRLGWFSQTRPMSRHAGQFTGALGWSGLAFLTPVNSLGRLGWREVKGC